MLDHLDYAGELLLAVPQPQPPGAPAHAQVDETPANKAAVRNYKGGGG